MSDRYKFNYETKKGLSAPNILGNEPLMTDKEKNCILKYLKPNYVMFEWGSGGSTLYFPQFVKKYISIEHQMHWFRHIRNNLRRYKDINNKITLKYIPQNMDYDYEDKNWKYEWFKDYIDSIETFGINKYDVVLIDGENRTRGFCAEKALDYIDKNSIVFIHDYYVRSKIHYIESYYDVIEKIEDGATLVVLVKK